jgi:hypothetical protein
MVCYTNAISFVDFFYFSYFCLIAKDPHSCSSFLIDLLFCYYERLYIHLNLKVRQQVPRHIEGTSFLLLFFYVLNRFTFSTSDTDPMEYWIIDVHHFPFFKKRKVCNELVN